MTYKIKDRNGFTYEMQNIESFAKHIFEAHATGSSLHQQNGHDFIVDDAFREKVYEFVKIKKEKQLRNEVIYNIVLI